MMCADHARYISSVPPNDNTYAVVRIKSGEAVLENVYVDGKPIAEFIREAKR
jgi:hypothetical protein